MSTVLHFTIERITLQKGDTLTLDLDCKDGEDCTAGGILTMHANAVPSGLIPGRLVRVTIEPAVDGSWKNKR